MVDTLSINLKLRIDVLCKHIFMYLNKQQKEKVFYIMTLENNHIYKITHTHHIGRTFFVNTVI